MPPGLAKPGAGDEARLLQEEVETTTAVQGDDPRDWIPGHGPQAGHPQGWSGLLFCGACGW
ncbi:hypothetical protein LMG29739_04062 [Paraburkholderia solisilvae]|uniref:Uncharacterized protein n=1 Tax=Paraburkholderia solisilvae TaxID=624376 RepID=A0A6J5ECE8_9BURK|nr:hypothetical protein LMG29739_04062 [Paraburkholderia solisilvae]